MFQPRMKLIPEVDGQFSLLAETPVPNAFYTAGKATKGAPKDLTVGTNVTAVTLPLKYKHKSDAGEQRIVFHRAFDLDLEAGTVLKACVTLDGKTLAEANMLLVLLQGRLVGIQDPAAGAANFATETAYPLTGVELTIELCRMVVVQASFNPERFRNPAQPLRELGVMDGPRAKNHKDRIRKRLIPYGFDIDPDKISSGPLIQVGACAGTVFNNATT